MMKRRVSVSLALLAIATALLMVTGHRADVVRADVGCGPALIKNSYGFALSGLTHLLAARLKRLQVSFRLQAPGRSMAERL